MREYYAYEPNEPPYWPAGCGRLRGWRIKQVIPIEQTPDARGWLWSEALANWLAPDGALLRLYVHTGQLRLTEDEAQRAAREAERAAKEIAWAKLRELGIDPESLV